MEVEPSTAKGNQQYTSNSPAQQQQQQPPAGGGEPNASQSADAAASAQNAPSFRRQRASRACETCHARKVRCDAASLGVPCTNCVAFQIECKIPAPKRKKPSGPGGRDSDSERGDVTEDRSPVTGGQSTTFQARPTVYHSSEGTPATTLTEAQARKEEVDNSTFVDLVMKPKFTRAPITEAGRVAFLGESSNLTLLVHDRQGSSDVVHYPLPDNVRGSRARLTELDNIEIDILHQRGAFLLPPRALCDELIEAYFRWVHPIVPVVNRTRFMKQYRDSKNPPSLLLLQAILLAGSRVCTNPQLMDANGSTTPAALTFYKRAKALYDANYEDDRVTIVQSLILMGWYWEGPEDVTKNVFYWSRVATIVAQGSGMHRTVEESQLSKTDKRLWKRIWWVLFTRDRSVAVALGRPVHINLDDADVEMLTEDDFIEDEGDYPSPYPPDPIHVQFFLQYVKLCEIMGLVLSQQYSVASKGRQRNAIDLTHSDMTLADWLQNCPKNVYWEMPRHHFWSALLHANYYTTLCLLHRAHMPPNTHYASKFPDDSSYPSRNIAFQAAGMITSIIENLSAHDELRYCPAFINYSLFSALIMHVYQMRSPVPSIQQVTHDRIRTCMAALKDVSKVWLVGKMVYTLFEAILGNRTYEERLQKAAGKRHHKKVQQTMAQLEQHQQAQLREQREQQRPQEAAKRKYDEMAIDFSVNTPTPQESYERSRPQTPAHTRSEHSHPQMGPPGVTSPHARAGDTFMGGSNSRPHTRPATPFNPSFSVPATPPDLYLVTRNSPNLSQAIWENFQPDQLFPENTIVPQFPQMSPSQGNQGLDPNLMAQFQNMPPGNAQMQNPAAQHFQQQRAPPGSNQNNRGQSGSPHQQHNNNLLNPNMVHFGAPGSNLWQGQGVDGMPDGLSPSDSWSTGSAAGQPVPATLNVEDCAEQITRQEAFGVALESTEPSHGPVDGSAIIEIGIPDTLSLWMTRITLTVSNPELEGEDLRLVTLEVFPEMTIEALRSSIEAEGIPEPTQHIYHNGQLVTDKSKTIQQLGITDGDMLALHIRDMRGSAGLAGAQDTQRQQQSNPVDISQDPELIRLQVLGDPNLRSELQRTTPGLAAVLDDPRRFNQLFRELSEQQEQARLSRMREIEQLNNDEFNPEAQSRIEEIIRQQNVTENLQNAMEYNPESFGRVHMLYVDVKVNGVKVKALVDSGAQATIMSPSCAESCHIMHLVDKRFAGVARGVGTAAIIGRVHYTTLQLGSIHLPAAFTVMEGKSVDLLLGLDILKGHQATIDLARNKLIIQGQEVDFLGEADVPKETEEAVNEEPTVQGPGGTTIGTRSGAVTASGASAPAHPVPAANQSHASIMSPQATARSGAGVASRPAPQQAATTFPEPDIQTLMDLGATRERAIQALQFTGGNVEFAANVIFQEM